MCNCKAIRDDLGRAIRKGDVVRATAAVRRGVAEMAKHAVAKPKAVAAALARRAR